MNKHSYHLPQLVVSYRMRNTTVTLEALCAECIINGKLFNFPIDIQTVPWMLYEKIWNLVALRNHLTHKFREGFQKYDKNLSFSFETPLSISTFLFFEKSNFMRSFLTYFWSCSLVLSGICNVLNRIFSPHWRTFTVTWQNGRYA